MSSASARHPGTVTQGTTRFVCADTRERPAPPEEGRYSEELGAGPAARRRHRRDRRAALIQIEYNEKKQRGAHTTHLTHLSLIHI